MTGLDAYHSGAVNWGMRSLPLTPMSNPGGRPRKTRAPGNAFGAWLASCSLTPIQIAAALDVSISTVYNLRNGYFPPGRELANKIATLTESAVTSESWDTTEIRPRKTRTKVARKVGRRKKAA